MDKEEINLAKLLVQEEPRRSGRPTYQQFKGLQADDEANSSIREEPLGACAAARTPAHLIHRRNEAPSSSHAW